MREYWRCYECGVLVTIDEIWQTNNGNIYCGDCFPNADWQVKQEPRLCVECGEGVSKEFLGPDVLDFAGLNSNVTERSEYCDACIKGVDPDKEAQAVVRLLQVLEETQDEEG